MEEETNGVEKSSTYKFWKFALLNIVKQKWNKLYILLLFLVEDKNNFMKKLVKVYKIQQNQKNNNLADGIIFVIGL